jgi:hypothetical protein
MKLAPLVNRGFTIGLLQGQLAGAGPDFFDMPEDELALWEGAEA